MAKFFLFFVCIIIVIVGVLIFLYFEYEKPKQQEVGAELVNLTIYSFDKYDETQVATNFVLYKDGVEFYNGSTVEGGGSLVNVPINHTYTVKSYNKDNQQYYTTWKDLSLFGSHLGPQRVELQLGNPGDISAVITEDPIQISDNLTLSTTNRDIKNVSICIKWSVNLISVVAEGINVKITKIDTYAQYKNYDKCFYVGTLTASNQPYIIQIYPTTYIDSSSRDYIDIIVIDQDCFKNDCKIDDNGIDLGMKNVILSSKLFVFVE